MATRKYQQCELQRGQSGQRAIVRQVAWIPKRFAVPGRWLCLLIDSRPSDGWQVVSVYGDCDEKHLPDAHSGIKHHRKRTGDSEPRRT